MAGRRTCWKAESGTTSGRRSIDRSKRRRVKRTTDGPQTDHRRTTDGQQTDKDKTGDGRASARDRGHHGVDETKDVGAEDFADIVVAVAAIEERLRDARVGRDVVEAGWR